MMLVSHIIFVVLALIVVCSIVILWNRLFTEHFQCYAKDSSVLVITENGAKTMAMAPFKGLPRLATLTTSFEDSFYHSRLVPQQLKVKKVQQQQQIRRQQQQQQEKQQQILKQQQERQQQERQLQEKQQQERQQQERQQQILKQQQEKQRQERQQQILKQQQEKQRQERQQQILKQQQEKQQQERQQQEKQQQERQQQQQMQKLQQKQQEGQQSEKNGIGNMDIKRTTSEYRVAMLDELNNARQCYNLQPLQLHDVLNKSAQAMADQIAQRSFNPNAASPHDDYDNKTPDDRAKAAGWKYDTWVGENISYNPNGLQPGQKQEDVDDWVLTNPRASVDGWLCSKGHRDALLDPFRTHVGIAYASGTLPNIRSLCVTPLGTIPNTPLSQYNNPNTDCNFQCKDAPNH